MNFFFLFSLAPVLCSSLSSRDVSDALLEAIMSCDREVVSTILLADPKLLEEMEWTPFLGLVASPETQNCSSLLSQILMTTDLPVNVMNQALSSAIAFDRMVTAKSIFHTMNEWDQKLENGVFQVICTSGNTSALLEYVLTKRNVDEDDLVKGAQGAFTSGQVVNMNLLLSHLGEDQIASLLPVVIEHVTAHGCPGTLEAILDNPVFVAATTKHERAMKNLTSHAVKRALENIRTPEFVRAADVLLRNPAYIGCSDTILYRSLFTGNIDMGKVAIRRCPSTIQDLDSQIFIKAMDEDYAPAVFQAFADIFIKSASDLEGCLDAALGQLDKDFISIVYEWAKSNDYMISLDARMKMVDTALKRTDVPETFNRPSQTAKRHKILSEIQENRRTLLSMDLAKSVELDIAKAQKGYELQEAIKAGHEQLGALGMNRPRETTTLLIQRRLWTLVYTEDVTLQRLKQIARNHKLENLLMYLDKYNVESTDL